VVKVRQRGARLTGVEGPLCRSETIWHSIVQIVSAAHRHADISLPWLSPFSVLRNRRCLENFHDLRIFLLTIITAALGGRVPDDETTMPVCSARMRVCVTRDEFSFLGC